MDGPKYNFADSIYWGESTEDSYRETGPSWISLSGELVFEGNRTFPGTWCRAVGPAIIKPYGQIEFMMQGMKHRIDGPARIDEDGVKEYWVEGVELSQLEFFAIYGVM